MGYQFIHIEGYARQGATQKKQATGEVKNTRSMREITDEAERKPGATDHIEAPQEPVLLYGCMPAEAADMAEAWAAQATDVTGRKLRKDGQCLLAGVISLPREREQDSKAFFKASIEWLEAKYGDRLKSVMFHDDEPHPHIHFYAVPRPGENFADLHEGVKAAREHRKEKKGVQNRAYREAMRVFQNEFSNEVAMHFGLTRLGPGRRRLSREAWKKEQQQAEFLANAAAVNKHGFKKGYKAGMAKAKAEADAIIEKARQEANNMGSKVASVLSGFANRWHKPTAEAEQAQLEAEARAKEAKAELEKVRAAERKKADDRVTAIATQLQKERAKVQGLETDLDKAEGRASDLAEELAAYQTAMRRGVKPGDS